MPQSKDLLLRQIGSTVFLSNIPDLGSEKDFCSDES